MNPPLYRLRLGLTILGIIFVVAVLGYWLLGDGWSMLDAIYMVVITLSTVGYKEVHELTPQLQLFTILVIVFGVSAALYIVGGFAQMMAEGETDLVATSRSRQVAQFRVVGKSGL